MSFKQTLKRIIPKLLHHLYNRVVSRGKIASIYGDWFELDWKKTATNADDETWKKVYNVSWEHWSQQDLSPLDLTKIEALVPENVTLLDAGCGDGYLLAHLLGKGRILSGVDLSETAIRKARERLGNAVNLQTAFLEKLPYCDKEFDVVVSAHTLEHVKQFGAAVSELQRVCKQRLILLVPSQEYLPYTQDYHLHFFPKNEDFLNRVNIPNARLERYTVSDGLCAYAGDVLLLVVDFA
ncbi:MAG: class I SAM-dependent methyltransferase [bacterium]|nr:class I SAM-dependent methyltransferase [bacterium]